MTVIEENDNSEPTTPFSNFSAPQPDFSDKNELSTPSSQNFLNTPSAQPVFDEVPDLIDFDDMGKMDPPTQPINERCPERNRFGYVPCLEDFFDFFYAPVQTKYPFQTANVGSKKSEPEMSESESSTTNSPMAIRMVGAKNGGDSSSSSENGEVSPKSGKLVTLPSFRETCEDSDSSGDENDSENFFRRMDPENRLGLRDTPNIFDMVRIQPGGVLQHPQILVGDIGREPAASTAILTLPAPPSTLSLPPPPQFLLDPNATERNDSADCLRLPRTPPICMGPPAPRTMESNRPVCPDPGQPLYHTVRPPPIYTESEASTPHPTNMETDFGEGFDASGQDSSMGDGEQAFVENGSWEHFRIQADWKLNELNGRLSAFEENFSTWVEQVFHEHFSESMGEFEQKGFEMITGKEREFVVFFNEEVVKVKNEMVQWFEQAKTQVQAFTTQTQNPGLQISDVNRLFQNKWVEIECQVRKMFDTRVTDFEARLFELHERIQNVSNMAQVGRISPEEVHRLVQEKLGQHHAKIQADIQHIRGECKNFVETKFNQPCLQAQQLQLELKVVKEQNGILQGRLDRLEALFGGRDVPWEKMMEMYNTASETIKGEVKRELDARERKVIEMLITQQLEEKFRDFKKEEHFEKLRGEISDMTREQLRIMGDNVFQNFQKSKEHRRKLHTEMNVLQGEFRSLRQSISSFLNPPSPPAQVRTMGGTQPKPAPTSTLSATMGAGLEDISRVVPKIPRANSFFDIVDTQATDVPTQHFFIIDDDVPNTQPQFSSSSRLHINQVASQTDGTQNPNTIVSGNHPVAQHVIRNVTIPKFTGRAQDWGNFVQDWERYLRKLSVCIPTLTNEMKLELWEGVLDEASLKFFRMRQKELGGKMSYTEEFAKMNARFSRDQNIGARRYWEEIVLYNPGKVGSREWREFEANFVTAWKEVEGATGEEARRLLLSRVPNFILRWVTEEEERRSFANPTVKMNAPPEIQLADEVSTSILRLIGKNPTKVSKTREGEFEIILPDFSDTEKLLNYNGKCFRNTSIVVKVSRIENILSVEEIFLLVSQKLALRDKQDLLQTANQHSTWGRGRTRSVSLDSKPDHKNSGEKKKASTPPAKIPPPLSPKPNPAPSNPVESQAPNPPVQSQIPPQPTTPAGGKGGWSPNPNPMPWQNSGKGPKGSWQPTQGKSYGQPWQGKGNQWGGRGGGEQWSQPGKGGKGYNNFGWQQQNWTPQQPKGEKGKGKGEKGGKGKGRGFGGRG